MQKMQRLQLQKDQEDLKQLEVLQKSLRGREYTYDHNGQVVFVNKPNTEKLPAYGAGLRVNVPETSGGLQTHGKYKRFANVGSSKLMETDFIEKEKSSQPSALEVMQMAKGVTLREGGGAKADLRLDRPSKICHGKISLSCIQIHLQRNSGNVVTRPTGAWAHRRVKNGWCNRIRT